MGEGIVSRQATRHLNVRRKATILDTSHQTQALDFGPVIPVTVAVGASQARQRPNQRDLLTTAAVVGRDDGRTMPGDNELTVNTKNLL